jgi:hypothetical protein
VGHAACAATGPAAATAADESKNWRRTIMATSSCD